MACGCRGTTIYSSVFFGCTYYEGRASTFDEDPSLECWSSGWWWLYALISGFGFGGLVVSALIRDKRLGSMEHAYPCTRQFGFFLSMGKISTSLLNVAMGEYHTEWSCGLTLFVLFIVMFYLVFDRPWAHTFINRWCERFDASFSVAFRCFSLPFVSSIWVKSGAGVLTW